MYLKIYSHIYLLTFLFMYILFYSLSIYLYIFSLKIIYRFFYIFLHTISSQYFKKCDIYLKILKIIFFWFQEHIFRGKRIVTTKSCCTNVLTLTVRMRYVRSCVHSLAFVLSLYNAAVRQSLVSCRPLPATFTHDC